MEQAILRRPESAEHHGMTGFARQLFAKLAERRIRADIICSIKAHHSIKKWNLWLIARGRWNNVERILAHHAQLKPAWITAAIVSFDQWGKYLHRIVWEISVDWNLDVESASRDSVRPRTIWMLLQPRRSGLVHDV